MAIRIDDTNTIWLMDEIERRGIDTRYYEESRVLELRVGEHVELMTFEAGPLHQRLYVDILSNKARLKGFLRERGFAVSAGRVFPCSEWDALRDYVASEFGFPCVVKAIDRSCGDFIFPNIRSFDELDAIFDKTIAPAGLQSVMAEAQFPTTDDYRFFVCEGHPVEVIKRTAPSTVGDGINNIQALVDAENKRRLVPRRKSVSNRIHLEDADGVRALSSQALHRRSVPEKDQRVVLRYTSNAQYGGVTTGFTAATHASYKDIARQVLSHFPGRKYVWVDMLITTPELEASATNHVIVEMAAGACYAGFKCPTEGPAVDIVPAIVDALFPETRAYICAA